MRRGIIRHVVPAYIVFVLDSFFISPESFLQVIQFPITSDKLLDIEYSMANFQPILITIPAFQSSTFTLVTSHQ